LKVLELEQLRVTDLILAWVLKWGAIIILVMIKQWHKQQITYLYDPATPAATYVSFTAKGQIIAFDLAPLWFCFREHAGFEPYKKVSYQSQFKAHL
jgi:hypothetical protein